MAGLLDILNLNGAAQNTGLTQLAQTRPAPMQGAPIQPGLSRLEQLGAALQPLAQYQMGRSQQKQMNDVWSINPDFAKSYYGGLAELNRAQQGSELPSNIREWQIFNAMNENDQKKYLSMKRASQLTDYGGGIRAWDPVTQTFGGPDLPKTAPPQTLPEFQADVTSATKEAEREQELIGNAPKAIARVESAQNQAQNILASIQDARDALAGPATGGYLGQKLEKTGGTPAFNAAQALETIKANLGFAELQAMRDASPTGGALGQVAVQELDALQATIASLKMGQDDKTLLKNLTKVEGHIKKWADAVQKNYERTYQGGSMSTGGDLSGYTDEQLRAMLQNAN